MKKIKKFFSDIYHHIADFFSTKVSPIFTNKINPFFYKIWRFITKYTGIDFLGKMYQKKLSNKAKKAFCGYMFILPFIIGVIVFGFQPIFNSIRMAFADFAGTKVVDGVPQFIVNGFSLTQFTQIFTDNPDHVEIIINTASDVAIVVPLVLVFSLILSLMLNKKIKGSKVFRMIFFIPVILLSGNLLGYFTEYGLLVVPALKGEELKAMLDFYLPAGFSNVITSAFDKVVLILWLGGVQTLIFLAGLQKTNKPIYEAASIDGASKWEAFWKITFPSMIPLMIINIVYTTVIYANLGNEFTDLISKCIVSPDFGRDYASALAWILFLMEIIIAGVYVLVLKIANKRYD